MYYFVVIDVKAVFTDDFGRFGYEISSINDRCYQLQMREYFKVLRR